MGLGLCVPRCALGCWGACDLVLLKMLSKGAWFGRLCSRGDLEFGSCSASSPLTWTCGLCWAWTAELLVGVGPKRVVPPQRGLGSV